MTTNLVLSFAVQRNEDDGPEVLRFIDKASRDAIDITGWAFEFRIHSATGLGTPLLTLNGIANANGSYIKLLEPQNGTVERLIRKADIEALPGRDIDVVLFAYNVMMTDSLGYVRAGIVGPYTVKPGV